MERTDLHSRLEEKLSECWSAYQTGLLALPPERIIEKAAEIAAARFCYDELTENPSAYSDNLLESLLEHDDPLELLREQWLDEQYVDHSGEFEHALWSLWDHGPPPETEQSWPNMNM